MGFLKSFHYHYYFPFFSFKIVLLLYSGWAGGSGPEPGHAEPQDERGTRVHQEVEGNAGNLVPVPVPHLVLVFVIDSTGYRYRLVCPDSGLNSESKF